MTNGPAQQVILWKDGTDELQILSPVFKCVEGVAVYFVNSEGM